MQRLTLGIAALALILAAVALHRLVTSNRDLRQQVDELRRTLAAAQEATSRELRELRASIREDAPIVRSSSAEALPLLRSGEEVAEALPSDPTALADVEARLAELEEIARTPQLGEALYERFPRLTGRAREDALEVLAELARVGDRRALDLVIDALSDPDEQIREDAVEAIGDTGDPALLSHLEAATGDPSHAVRREAAAALRRMPPDEARAVLVRMLADPDARVVEESIQSLASLGVRDAASRIMPFSTSSNPELAAEAGRALRELGNDQGAVIAVHHVLAGLQSADPGERLGTVRRLARIGHESAAPYLKVLLEDPDPKVSDAARKALARYGW